MSDIQRFKARLASEECRTERAAHAVYEAVADFTVAIKDARTIAEARRIWVMLGPLMELMSSTEAAALNKTDELNR